MTKPDPRRARVLVVDDEQSMAEMLADGLGDRGYEARAVSSSEEAARLLEGEAFDALVTDLRMPRVDGLGLLAISKRARPERPVILMTAYGAIDSAIEAMRQGASHYLTKPFGLEELALFLERALDESRVRTEAKVLRAVVRERFSKSAIVGESRAMRDVFEVLERLAESDAPVLFTGETGTGKGLVARAVHAEGARAGGPFVTINCSALPETLLESELFGHEKGSFTGATRDRAGLIVEADRGTLFLDEVGEMSPAVQVKLLDVLERHVVRPVGSSRERAVDVRILAATHRDLAARVRDGHFREDLRYRLEVVTLELPPLRRRREDIPELVTHFFARAKERHPSSPAERVAAEAILRMTEYAWPGNVRELAHAVERMVVLARSPELGIADLPAPVRSSETSEQTAFRGDVLPIRELQRRYAAWALDQLGGHRTRTAEKLGVDLKTLAKWLSSAGEGDE